MEKEYFASINEVAQKLNVPAHTLRYWEKQFPVIVRPTTGAGGRRYYRAETVQRLQVIQDLLYNRGMTIAGVKKMLRNGTLPTSLDTDVTPTINTPAKANRDVRSEIDVAIELLKSARTLLG